MKLMDIETRIIVGYCGGVGVKLKQIEDGMVVHCKTEDEEKELIKWARECGFKFLFECEISALFNTNSPAVCFHFDDNSILSGYYTKYISAGYKITEFSDLVISEEQEKHMGAEEIIEWL